MNNYCKTCRHDDGDIGFCDKCYYNHILEEKGIPPTEYEARPQPPTNADRIRAMSDEELASWLALHPCLPNCPAQTDECFKSSKYENCKKQWLDWLKLEVKNE